MKVTPFLMFEGRAEEAMKFYESVFPNAKVVEIVRYGAGQPGKEGSVMKATFTVGEQTIKCTDSFVKHGFTFTPAFSLWVECDSVDDIRRFTTVLSEGGNEFMPLNNYGFSRQFAWVGDKFGVTWQLNLT